MLVAFLAYYWTGFDMVLYHQGSNPMDRPAYVRGPFYSKILIGAVWPYTCFRNEELGWFVCCFFSSLVVIAFSLAILTIYLSYFWAILIIGLIRTLRIPIISKVYFWGIAAVFFVVWMIFSKLFPIQEPSSLVRYNQYQNQIKAMRR